MRMTPVLFATALALALPATTQAQTPGAKDNRLVGTWLSQGQVSPCGQPSPVIPVAGLIAFHTGGTVSEIARAAPGGANGFARSDALGTWSYEPSTDTYHAVFQFFLFANGVYSGHQVVEREIRLQDGQAVGPVRSVQYDPAGNVTLRLCGQGTSTPL